MMVSAALWHQQIAMSVFDSTLLPEGQDPAPVTPSSITTTALGFLLANPEQSQRNRILVQLLAASSSKASPKYVIS